MLQIDKPLRPPAKRQANEGVFIINQVKTVGFVAQNAQLRGVLALLMRREAIAIQRHRPLAEQVLRAGQSLKTNQAPPCFISRSGR